MMGKLWNTGPALQRMAGCSSKFIYFCRKCIFNGGSVATAIATGYILTCLWKKNQGVPINRFCSSEQKYYNVIVKFKEDVWLG